MAKSYVQIPTAYLSGSGVVLAATSIVINSFTDIYGNVLTMTDFGDEGYGTIEPDTTNEESFTFTTITPNANGTVTLGGIKTSLAKSPYTETSGLIRSHVGGSKLVVSDTAAFWATFANKFNNETIFGIWTFNTPPGGVAPGGIPDASTTAMGASRSSASPNITLGVFTVTIASPGVFTLNNHGLTVDDRVQFTTTGALPTGLSVATTYYVISSGLTANNFQVSASLSGTAVNTSGSQSGIHTLIKSTPVYLAITDYRVGTNSYGVDTGAANAYVITVNSGLTAYIAGQRFSFKATNANTTASTLNVTALGAKTIKKQGGATDLAAGDIAAGMIVEVEYDGTNMIMLNPVAGAPAAAKFGGTGADGALSTSSGTTNIDLGGAQFVIKNYTSISITGTANITFTNPHANGTTVIFKSQANVDITSSANPVIDLRGIGATGGAGGALGSSGVAAGGTGGCSMIAIGALGSVNSTSNGGAGTVGTTALGMFFRATGGGGGTITNVAQTPGAFSIDGTYYSTFLGKFPICPGSGGGGAGGSNNASGGVVAPGGRGGGAFYIECNGAYNFTTGTINLAGTAGTNGGAGFASGGGGGGAGSFLCAYNTLTANSGTYTVTGGAAGTSVSGNPGGAGAAGQAIVVKNTEFV